MSSQGKFYAHTAVDKDMVVCESPQRVEEGENAGAAPGAPAPAAPTAAAHTHSGYSKWERFDADAAAAALDASCLGADSPRQLASSAVTVSTVASSTLFTGPGSGYGGREWLLSLIHI